MLGDSYDESLCKADVVKGCLQLVGSVVCTDEGQAYTDVMWP